MLKLLVMILGLALGASAASAWLLSQDSTSGTSPAPAPQDSLTARVQTLKARFLVATAEGGRAQERTELRLQHQLDAYRKGSRLPASS